MYSSGKEQDYAETFYSTNPPVPLSLAGRAGYEPCSYPYEL